MSLPFLPGLSLNPTAPRPRKQFFSRDDGVTAEKGGTKRPVHKRATAFGATASAAQAGEAVPAWLAFAGQALRFRAFFQEALTETPAEHFKVRKVIIVFHLEDDSISVVEPTVENSGQPHGVLLRRHRIPLPSDADDHYMPDDLFIGAEVSFYGRVYRIVDADEFTRKFFRRQGVPLGEKEDYPEDQHSRALEKREKEKRRVTAPKPEVDAKAQFLTHDKDVLEFYCKWDEKRMFAEARKFRLQYFLADDQIQLVEMHRPNCGRDQSGPFLRKQKLRRPEEHRAGGARAPMADDPTGAPRESYHWRDLRVGERIDVLGRPFLIYDCDKRTKRFYEERLKIVFQPLTLHEPREEVAVPDAPPYNGWGSEEDSLLSTRSLVPQAPRQDVAKLLKNDRQVTRFAAKLVSTVEEDAERDFVITYYLMDDTIGIYEPAKRNSGMVSGKFLERQRIRKDGGATARGGPVYYCAGDLFVGARITVNAHTFVLLETDEFSLRVMEGRPEEFPRADLERIHDKLRAFFLSGAAGASPEEVFRSMDVDGNGTVSCAEFTGALRELRAACDLSDQEIIHLMRHYDTDGDNAISYAEFSAILTSEDIPLPANPATADARGRVLEPPRIDATLVRDSVREAIAGLDAALRARRGQLLASFREFDLDRDSKLSLAEFRGMLSGVNLALSQEQKDLLVNHFYGDRQVADQGGKMGFQRFLVLLQRDPTADVVLRGVNSL